MTRHVGDENPYSICVGIAGEALYEGTPVCRADDGFWYRSSLAKAQGMVADKQVPIGVLFTVRLL